MPELRERSLSCDDALALLEEGECVLVDLRDKSELAHRGRIPGSVYAPYGSLSDNLARGGPLHELAHSMRKRLVFYCAYGERSAMAVQAADEAGISLACHIQGGLNAWKKGNGPVT